MKILSIGLDNSILDKNSHLAGRVIEYGNLVDKYTVIVPGRGAETVNLSDKVKVYGAGKGNKIFKFFKVFKLTKKILKLGEYNLITVQDQYYLAWLAYRLARKFKIGLEIQVHGFEKYSRLRKIIAKYVIPKADSIRAVSQRIRQRLVDEFKVSENKITVVPIFSNFQFPCLAGRQAISNFQIKKKDDKFVFLTVSRLVGVKNIEMQIRAMANDKLKEKNVKLRIVGEGPLISDFRFQISDLKLENKVKLLGWQDDLEKFYEQADAFLLTSNCEGWGLVVVEAASFGLPIIMTDVGCAGELIKDGESGIVIPVGDQEALEKAMVKLIEDENLRNKLGRGAAEAVEGLPSKEETLKLYLKSWQIAKRCK